MYSKFRVVDDVLVAVAFVPVHTIAADDEFVVDVRNSDMLDPARRGIAGP